MYLVKLLILSFLVIAVNANAQKRIDSSIVLLSSLNKDILIKEIPTNNYYVFCLIDSINKGKIDFNQFIPLETIRPKVAITFIFEGNFDSNLSQKFSNAKFENHVFLCFDSYEKVINNNPRPIFPQYLILDKQLKILQSFNNLDDLCKSLMNYYLQHDSILDGIKYQIEQNNKNREIK